MSNEVRTRLSLTNLSRSTDMLVAAPLDSALGSWHSTGTEGCGQEGTYYRASRMHHRCERLAYVFDLRTCELTTRYSQHCRKLSNISTMTAMFAGLNVPPVSRLNQTWACVSTKHKRALQACLDMVTAMASHKPQEVNRGVKPPGVPFLGAIDFITLYAYSKADWRRLCMV